MITFDPRPQKIFEKLNKKMRNDIMNTISELEKDPQLRRRHGGAKIYTVRVGHFCIGYLPIDDVIRVIQIKKIK